MITQQDKNEIIEIRGLYVDMHDKLTSLTQEAALLEMRRTKLSQELESLRKREKDLINKIEEYTGGKIDQSTILKIINEHGE